MGSKPKWGRRHRAIAAGVYVAVILGAYFVAMNIMHKYNRQEICDVNFQSLALAVEQCIQDTGRAPQDFEEMLSLSKVTGQPPSMWLRNPYSRAFVRQIKLGEAPTPGDVFYLPAMSEHTFVGSSRIEQHEDGFLLVMFGTKRIGEVYLDIDGNGMADPVMYIQSKLCTKMSDRNIAWERPEQTLARHGYTRSLDEPLPDA